MMPGGQLKTDHRIVSLERLRILAFIVGLAVTYFFVARLGLQLATINNSASPVWPATGLAIAAVFLFGRKSLAGIFFGAFAANLLVGGPVASALLISIGNTAEATIGATILRKLFSHRKRFGSSTEPLAFICASIFGSLLSATFGVTALITWKELPFEEISSVWVTWVMGDALGGLVFAPLLIHIGKTRFVRDMAWPLALNGLMLILLLSVVFFYVPGGSFLFLVFPPLLFAALYLGRSFVLICSSIVCAVSVFATISGEGPFALGSLNERLLHLQLFLAGYAVTSLMLASVSRPHLSKPVAGVLLGCWLLTGIVFHSFDTGEKRAAEVYFVSRAAEVTETTRNLVETYEQLLRSGVALHAASYSVNFTEWDAFGRTLITSRKHDGLGGIGVMWAVDRLQLAKFERDMGLERSAPFRIRTLPGFDAKPGDTHRQHFIVRLFSPSDLYESAPGLDVTFEPNRRSTAEMSRDTGGLALSSRVNLITGSPGFLMMLPIYKTFKEHETIEARRADHLGWVYAPVAYHEFFSDVFAKSTQEVELELFEGKTPTTKSLVFSNFKKPGQNYELEQQIQLGQRSFVMRWAKSSSFVSSHNTVVAWVGFCGALATILIANLVMASQRVGYRARLIANELTRELSLSRENFREGERRLQYALDGSQDGIWDWNIGGGEMYVSGKIAEAHGWPQLFKVKSADDLKVYAHPNDIRAIVVSVRDVLSGQSATHDVETRYRTKQGDWRWVLSRGKVSERNADGQPTRMTGVHIDIHERKSAQILLEETQYQLTNIANSVPTLISFWSKDLKCRFANDLYCDWFGLTPLEIVGVALQDLISAEDFAERRTIFDRAIAGENFRFEREILRPADRELRHVVVTYRPNAHVADSNGFFIFIQDITELKEAELRALDGQKAAIEAANVKAQFLANMSHEIRTPLNGVIGIADLLLDTALDTRQREYSEIIARSSQALLNIINDILDFSKIEAGKLRVEKVEFKLNDIISDAMNTLHFVARGKGLMFHSEIAPYSIDRFKGDPGRIRQVLLNLLGNALKFTESGGVVLRVLVSEAHNASRVRFEIVDTGIGISEDAIGRMFQSFSQADSTTTRRFGGTGLGLSICKQLVQLMGGDIGLESRIGKGSKFWFQLDLAHVDVSKSLPVAATPAKVTEARSASGRGHILVVEDNQVNQLVITMNLKALGFTLDTAMNGVEALSYLAKNECDLILMDCQLPEMDGFEATRVIRKSTDPTLAQIPIVALTANAMSGDRELCLQAGMNAYLTKPIDRKLLKQTLDQWIPKARLRPSG